MGVLDGLEPKELFRYFEEISRIPRPSYQEKRISDYLAGFARDHGLSCRQDELNNIIMIKEATPGYEYEPPVILQGHMDMVCEKEEGCSIDFSRDGLTLRVDGDLISAEGTTLGGDDGVALAIILAVFSDETLTHPRLEAVITVSEEVGMEGAKGLSAEGLQGKRLLNLDSELEGTILSSCAGGSTGHLSLPVERAPFSGKCYEIEIGGLLGGHSGNEIDKERANANLLMTRLLLGIQGDWRLSSIQGGQKQNAIPRQTTAQILVGEDADASFLSAVSKLQEAVRKEYAISDPGIQIQKKELQAPSFSLPLDLPSTKAAVTLLTALPRGIQSMSLDIPELVKTSLNLGILTTEENQIHFEYCIRSSLGSERAELEQRIRAITAFFGGTAEFSAEYPAWEYRKDSPFRDKAAALFEEMYGKKPRIEAIHAGVECGILAGKLPDLDMISIGPDMWDIHTTAERLSIASTRRVYEYVVELLQRKG